MYCFQIFFTILFLGIINKSASGIRQHPGSIARINGIARHGCRYVCVETIAFYQSLKHSIAKEDVMPSEPTEKIYELITMNRQIGHTYTVKMKDIPSPFIGVPVGSTNDPDKFVMDLTNTDPDEENRIIEGNIADIEYMEKC